MSHQEFERLVRSAPSPLKASKKAAQHVVSRARRVPLNTLLDTLERNVSRLTGSPMKGVVSSPTKLAKLVRAEPAQPRPALRRRGGTQIGCSGGGGGGSSDSDSHARAAAAAPARSGSFHSSRTHVVELYERYVARLEVEQLRAEGARKQEATAATARSMQRPHPGSFVDVLRLYYPHFSRPTIELMISDAQPGMDAIDRKTFIARAKGSYADRLKLAFFKADKDGSGGLSIDEFVIAIKATGAQPAGRSSAHPLSEADLRGIFSGADLDGNGILDFDEFLELCAHQPWLVTAFDRIVELGVRRKLREEETRLTTIFRHPVSPLSRMVRTPNGRRYRPGLFDLRPTEEIGETLARQERKH